MILGDKLIIIFFYYNLVLFIIIFKLVFLFFVVLKKWDSVSKTLSETTNKKRQAYTCRFLPLCDK